MKKILLLLVLSSSFCFGQFKVSESSADYTLVGKHYGAIKLYQKEGKAKIEYIDYNTIIGKTNILSPSNFYTFEFVTTSDTLDKIYNIIIDHFKSKKIEELTLEFPEGRMYLNFYKSFGTYAFNFKFDNNSSTLDKNAETKRETYGLTEKRTNKLFGK